MFWTAGAEVRTNSVRVTDITMHLEPDSVILRDPAGKQPIQVLEQNYRADPYQSNSCYRCSRARQLIS
jgi:hypothetical protein